MDESSPFSPTVLHHLFLAADSQTLSALRNWQTPNVGHLMMREGSLPLDCALEIAQAVGEALAYAHRHGIGHHDIKPSNVMLEAAGGVKVTDFGLAKIMTLDANADMAAGSGTGMGMIFGTPGYAAPELFVPRARVDHRAHLFTHRPDALLD